MTSKPAVSLSNDNRTSEEDLDEDLLIFLHANPLVNKDGKGAKVAEVQLSTSRVRELHFTRVDLRDVRTIGCYVLVVML